MCDGEQTPKYRARCSMVSIWLCLCLVPGFPLLALALLTCLPYCHAAKDNQNSRRIRRNQVQGLNKNGFPENHFHVLT